MAYHQLGEIDREERIEFPGEAMEELPPRRRGFSATLLTVLLLAIFAGGLWFAYREGTRHPAGQSGDDVPLIRADERPTKVRPDQPGGMDIPDRDKSILDEKTAAPAIERLLPQPEKPLPRPTAPQIAGVPVVPPAVSPAPGAAVQSAPLGAPSNAFPVGTGPNAAASKPPAAARTTPIRASAGKAEGLRVQIGAMRSPDLAKKEWERLKRRNSDLLGDLTAVAVRADLGDQGVFYRIQAGPVADLAAADKICGEMRRRDLGCVVVK
ncbi:MAG: SPOR domain-containing protein [Alphaproteobacteria bacterium]|nr:SPOR domain-containing protein [Alphaproteobacteria bacterium]